MTDMVEAAYQHFAAQCRTYLPETALQRIDLAYHFARDAHGTQRRKSGEPYITHPIAVAQFMADLFVDENLLTGALLHDVAEDTPQTLDDIEKNFGKQTRHLVDGVTHLANVSQLEDIAHLFLAMSSDVRVVLIKLYDRLHNMRTLECMPEERRRRKALETLRIYVPLAAKLGIWRLKTEFETLILNEIDHDAYQMINREMNARFALEKPKLNEIGTALQEMLRTCGIPANFRIQQKSLYSIYEDMRGRTFQSEVFSGAFQLVIQVDSLEECYLALGQIHSQYPHVAGSLADSIGNPRDIFYRSLHTSIIFPGHKTPVALRIRTYEFDRQSDIGILTKIQFVPPDAEKQPSDAPWLSELPAMYNASENPQKFVESIFKDILQKHIVCYTPRGDAVSLPRGATVLDFAYGVHTQIGHECRGALVNGDAVDLTHKLADRDQVEVLRSRGSVPYHEWLDDTLEYAITNRAKQKIRDYFRKQSPQLLIRKGREALNEERRRLNAWQLSPPTLAKVLQVEDANALYLAIGNGSLLISEVALAIIRNMPDIYEESTQRYMTVIDDAGQTGYLPIVVEQYQLRLARCCVPRVGDQIVARVKDAKVMIHRADCRNVRRSKYQESFISMDWLTSIAPRLTFYLRLEGYDRGGLIRDVSIPIAAAGANILHSYSKVIDDKLILMRLKIQVMSAYDFIRIVHQLTTLQNITLVQRMGTEEIRQWEPQNAAD